MAREGLGAWRSRGGMHPRWAPTFWGPLKGRGATGHRASGSRQCRWGPVASLGASRVWMGGGWVLPGQPHGGGGVFRGACTLLSLQSLSKLLLG